MVSKWRIFQRPIAVNVKNAILIIQATVCLHNYLIKRELNLPIENRLYSINVPVQDASTCEALHSLGAVEDTMYRGSTVRDQFEQYFYTTGAIEHQWKKAYTNDY